MKYSLLSVFVVVPGLVLATVGGPPGATASWTADEGSPSIGFAADGDSAGGNRGGPPVVPDQYIVVLEDGASPEDVAASHGLHRLFTYRLVFNGFAGFIPPGQVDAVRNDPSVAAVFPNRAIRLPDDPTAQGPGAAKPDGGNGGGGGKGGGGSTPPPGQVVPPNIPRVGADPGTLPYTGAGVAIAILDSGVDLENLDLNGLTAAGDCFDAFAGTPQFNNCRDDHGHGTHVAGIAAARNNTVDVVGVAPGATVVAVKVIDSTGNGTVAGFYAGGEWITANAGRLGIRVANASLGWTTDEVTAAEVALMHQGIQAMVSAGVVFVASAGNTSTVEVTQANGNPYIIPAGFSEVIAVASTTTLDGITKCRFISLVKADTASFFTTDGQKVKISAPGEEKEDIVNCGSLAGTGILSLKRGGGTVRMGGTSMSAPHVAGAAALLVQQNPAATVAAITSALSMPNTDREGTVPLDHFVQYTFDGVREGVLCTREALGLPVAASGCKAP